jgi:DNA-binding transcriptional regulator YhcF (GntR family)
VSAVVPTVGGQKKNWDTQNFLRLYQALNCQNKVKIKLTFTITVDSYLVKYNAKSNRITKIIIRQRLGEGITIRAIANELNVSKNTVLLAKQKLQTFGNIVRRPGSGRPKVTTDNEDFEMINFLRLHPFQTAIRARHSNLYQILK